MTGLFYEKFEIDQVFDHPLTRTVTEMDNTMFSLMTLNPQPLHIDAHYAAETEWGERIFNSLYTLGIMIGMPVYDTTLGTTIAEPWYDRRKVSQTRVPWRYVAIPDARCEQAREQIASRRRTCRIRAPRVEPAWRCSCLVPSHCAHAESRNLMRSLLFVPGDSPRKLEKAMGGSADVLIMDLEDSVASHSKINARAIVREALAEDCRHKRYVRINDLDTDLAISDLAAVMPGGPDGIMLPKCSSVADVDRLGHWLDALEAASDIPLGRTSIIAIATENARSIFGLGTYHTAGSRLKGLMWGGEDLAASLGATENRGQDYHSPYRLARDLCLMAAASAGVMAIDAVNVNVSDIIGIREEALIAYRDGFDAKAVIHPSHVDIINQSFTPTESQLDEARRILSSFDNFSAGVHTLGAKMIDKPHIEAAKRMLARGGFGE